MIAHRGLKTFDNQIGFFPYLLKRPNVAGIEFDVHRNTNKELVVTRNYVDKNKMSSEHLTMFPKFPKTKLIMDIKTNDYHAVDMARDVVHDMRFMMSDHEWYLCSFNKKCVDELVKLNTGEYECGYIHNGYLQGFEGVEDSDFVSLYWGYLTPQRVKKYHDRGQKVFAWTAPPENVQNLFDIGVDLVITDIH